MKIFIDESGSFIAGKGRHNFSCVGALMIPSTKLDRIYKDFKEISLNWPRNDKEEIKGTSLSEEQISNIARILRRHDSLLEVVVIDLNAESPKGLELHKKAQAEKFTRYLTDEFHPNLVQEIQALRQKLENLSMPLYIQAIMLTKLISRSAYHSTLYYAQRKPAELRNFEWIIDAKDKELTPYEKWWRVVVLPFLQSISIREPWPFVKMPSFNYKYFDREYLTVTPEYLKNYVPEMANQSTSIDINKIMKNMTFQQSHTDLGLQLVDILVNAVRRLLHSKLAIACAKYIGSLMIVTNKNEKRQNINILSLTEKENIPPSPRYLATVETLAQSGRIMLK